MFIVFRRLRDVLQRNLKRVVDMYVEMDENNDGLISRKEMFKGMKSWALLYQEGKLTFSGAFDKDGSGKVEYRELYTVLRDSAKKTIGGDALLLQSEDTRWMTPKEKRDYDIKMRLARGKREADRERKACAARIRSVLDQQRVMMEQQQIETERQETARLVRRRADVPLLRSDRGNSRASAYERSASPPRRLPKRNRSDESGFSQSLSPKATTILSTAKACLSLRG